MDVKLEYLRGMYLLFLWVHLDALESNSFCTQHPNTGPPLPSMSQRSFRAEIAGKIIEKKRSIHAIQTVSFEDNKYSLFWTAANTSQFFIVNMATNQTIAGDEDSCSLLTEKDPLILLASSSLDALQGDAEYIEDIPIKGISSSHWRKCSSWAMSINVTVDIYLTENDVLWSMPSVLPTVPVRVELTGHMWENGVIAPIHHVYDYIQFEQFEGDKYSAAFEPPVGVLCPGLKQEVLIPDMPTFLSYSKETKSSNQNYIDLETIFYDFVDKVSRTDYFDGVNEIHLIRDFNEGVLYKINMKGATCEVLPMTPVELQENDTSTDINWQYILDDNGYVQMQTVKNYFLLSGNFTYDGEHLVRGVPCDVYSRKIQNYKNNLGWTLIGLYFSKVAIQMYNTRGSVVLMENQLMRVTVENKITTTTDIYNVDPEPMPEKTPFDVSLCFNSSSQMPFLIYFTIDEVPAPNAEDIYKFTKLAVQQISMVANVSSIRVQLDEVSTDDDLIYLYGRILDVPAAYVRYLKRAEKKQDVSILPSSLQALVLTQVGLTARTCAIYCSKETSLGPLPEAVDVMRTCDSFDFCKSSESCYFYQRFNSSSFKKLMNDKGCDHFQKTTSSMTPTSIAEAWSRLREAVNREQLEVIIKKPNDSDSWAVFTGQSIKNLNPTSEDLAQSDAPLYSYEEIPGVQLYNPVVQKGSITLDDCARLCSNTLSFQCLSFVYCKNRLACALHNITFYEMMGYNKVSSCTTYSRSYVKDFVQVPDTSVLSGSDTVIQNIDDKEQCAYLCLNNTNFLCESFELCTVFGVGVCYIGRAHIYDIPTDDIQKDPNCQHYSRNYATDYDETPNKVTNYAAEHTISDVSVAQCAWICSTERTYNCSMFQFCGSQGPCQLISPATENIPISLRDKYSCSIFNKRKVSGLKKSNYTGDDGASVVEKSKSSSYTAERKVSGLKKSNYTGDDGASVVEKSKSSSYTAGAMAGVGAGMTVAGAGLTIVGLFIFIRVRRQRSVNSAILSELTMDEITEAPHT